MLLAVATDHARTRQQQRGITEEVLNLLLEFGEAHHDGRGAQLVTFTRRSRMQLRRELGHKAYAQWESRLDVYAVVSIDGTVITVGHRYQRLLFR